MLLRTTLVLAVAVAAVQANLGYIECSAGLEPPRMEGGRTELEFADLNNDGNVDIVGIGDHGSPFINTDQHGISVWFGNGAGGWDTFQFGNFGYGGIAVGDLNWDGYWDVGYGMHHNYSGMPLGNDMLEAALGDGTGRVWTAWDAGLMPGGSCWGMFSCDLGDVDGDGDLDLGSISFGYGVGLRVFLNNLDGTWTESFRTPESLNSRMQFYFCDVNRDGKADIVHAAAGPAVYFGDGSGGFSEGDTGLPRSNYGLAGIAAGDVDNDGGADVVFCNSNGGVEVWVWDDTTGRWQSRSSGLPSSGDFEGSQLCDMNCDGFTDVCAFGGASLKVWTGDGQGNWTEAAAVSTPTPGDCEALRTGSDFDHNGRPDIALVAKEGVWPNDRNRMRAFRESTEARTLAIFPVFPRGREKFLNGSVQFIDWWSEAPGAESTRVKLEFSSSGPGGPWELVADSLRNSGRFQWCVPQGVVSPDCYLRYTVSGPQGTATALTPRAFVVGDTVVGLAEAGLAQPVRLTVVPSVARAGAKVRFSPAPGAGCNLLVLDVAGRVAGSQSVPAGAREVPLRLGSLPEGAYFVRLDRPAEAVGKLVRRR